MGFFLYCPDGMNINNCLNNPLINYPSFYFVLFWTLRVTSQRNLCKLTGMLRNLQASSIFYPQCSHHVHLNRQSFIQNLPPHRNTAVAAISFVFAPFLHHLSSHTTESIMPPSPIHWHSASYPPLTLRSYIYIDMDLPQTRKLIFSTSLNFEGQHYARKDWWKKNGKQVVADWAIKHTNKNYKQISPKETNKAFRWSCL